MNKDILIKIQVDKTKYRIGKSSIEGNGVIATTHIKKDEFINPAFLPGMRITEFGAHLNHSYKPNAITRKIEDYRLTYSLFNIDPGEEITVDYTVNKDLEQPQKDWK